MIPFEVSLGDFRVEALRAAFDSWSWTPAMRCSMKVPDVDGGALIDVGVSVSIPAFGRDDKAASAAWVKEQIMKLLEHEVEEKLRIDGELAFDPHPEETRRKRREAQRVDRPKPREDRKRVALGRQLGKAEMRRRMMQHAMQGGR